MSVLSVKSDGSTMSVVSVKSDGSTMSVVSAKSDGSTTKKEIKRTNDKTRFQSWCLIIRRKGMMMFTVTPPIDIKRSEWNDELTYAGATYPPAVYVSGE
jgi:hypothetical protein